MQRYNLGHCWGRSMLLPMQNIKDSGPSDCLAGEALLIDVVGDHSNRCHRLLHYLHRRNHNFNNCCLLLLLHLLSLFLSRIRIPVDTTRIISVSCIANIWTIFYFVGRSQNVPSSGSSSLFLDGWQSIGSETKLVLKICFIPQVFKLVQKMCRLDCGFSGFKTSFSRNITGMPIPSMEYISIERAIVIGFFGQSTFNRTIAVFPVCDRNQP